MWHLMRTRNNIWQNVGASEKVGQFALLALGGERLWRTERLVIITILLLQLLLLIIITIITIITIIVDMYRLYA